MAANGKPDTTTPAAVRSVVTTGPVVLRADIGGIKVTTGFEITPDEHQKLVELCGDAGLFQLGIRLAKKEAAVLSAARRRFLMK